MRWRFWLFVGLILILQIAFLPALRPLGVVPNMILVLVILVGLTGTASLALGVALVGGLLLDLTSGADFGLRLGLLILTALATGFVHRAGLQAGGSVVALAVVAVATVVAHLTILAGLLAQDGFAQWPWGFLIGTLTLEIMLNLLIAMALWPLVKMVTPGTAQLPEVG
jgi:rod shape-determining protein MreD